MKITQQVSAVLQSIRTSNIVAKTVRNNKGDYESIYISPNGPVPSTMIAAMLKERIISSHINDAKRRLSYHLTMKGRELLRSLESSGATSPVSEETLE